MTMTPSPLLVRNAEIRHRFPDRESSKFTFTRPDGSGQFAESALDTLYVARKGG
jgi:hypothetical protein